MKNQTWIQSAWRISATVLAVCTAALLYDRQGFLAQEDATRDFATRTAIRFMNCIVVPSPKKPPRVIT